MQCAVIYESATGNTRQVALAIREALGGRAVYCGPPAAGVTAEVCFVGGWTDRGLPSPAAAAFLKGLRGGRVAYFSTAGFGASAEYQRTLRERMAALLAPECVLLGAFFCLGQMPQAVRTRLRGQLEQAPGDPALLARLRHFEEALGHPDGADLAAARAWALEMAAAAE